MPGIPKGVGILESLHELELCLPNADKRLLGFVRLFMIFLNVFHVLKDFEAPEGWLVYPMATNATTVAKTRLTATATAAPRADLLIWKWSKCVG